MTTKNEETCHSIWLDDREPLQLAIEMEKYGHEVEVKRLKTGDFEGQTSIGENGVNELLLPQNCLM